MNFNIKRICCIGAGYVGGPSMAIIAAKCPDIQVTVVDVNKQRIAQWNDTNYLNLPVYEPGLDQIIANCRGKNLFFSNEVSKNIMNADMIFISVNTPTKKRGLGAGQASDLKWIESSARDIAKHARGQTIVVEKSTIPVRTAEAIKSILYSSTQSENNIDLKREFFILSNPEFLAEGSAIEDLENPDRVLIGGEVNDAIESLANIYSKWVNPKKILKTNLWSSELSKLTANAFLAQRISSINSISALCEETGADIEEVSQAVGMDTRIGREFLKSGPGFGGSCFRKDILNLIYISNYYGLKEVANYWEKVLDINDWQQKRLTSVIVEKLFGTLSEKIISILGFSFKANTNDTRDSPSIKVCKDLLEEGAYLKIYDPKVKADQIFEDLELNEKEYASNIHKKFPLEISQTLFKSLEGADAIVILTDWDEFKNIDWDYVKTISRKPTWIFDTRGLTINNKIDKKVLNVWRVGYG